MHDGGEQLARQIDLAHEPAFTLAGICVEPSLRRLSSGDDEHLVEPKLMQVLVALAREPGRILSRDDLIDCCWDGRIVGDASVNRVLSLLRTALRDLGGDAVTIDTVPRVGYRLLLADQPDEVTTGDGAEAIPPSQPAPSSPKYRRPLLALAAVVLVALLAAAAWWARPASPVETMRIAMLPIVAEEGVDPLYAAGLESELRSQLAQSPGLEVTASESARLMLEEGQSPPEIGARLGVDIVWEGTLANSAEQVTLRASALDVRRGREIFSQELASAPASAHFLPQRSARGLLVALDRPVADELEPLNVSAEDYGLYLTALGLLRSRGRDQRVAALEILEPVVARNPQFAGGLGGLAMAHILLPTAAGEEQERHIEQARDLASRALAENPDAVEALKVLGLLGQTPEESLPHSRRAVELDPGDSEAWFWLGVVQRRFPLDSDNIVEPVQRMIEIDPLWPASWVGSNLAAEVGDLDLARQLERDILAAAITPSQRLLAEARLARLDGDFSQFLALAREAEPLMREAERQYGVHRQEQVMRVLLDLPSSAGGIGPGAGAMPRILDQLSREVLPPRAVLEAEGLTGAGAWNNPDFMSAALPLYLQSGREAELLANYDARFADHADYLAFADSTGQPEMVVPYASIYLAMAMRRAGRDEEAARHLASTREWVTRWRETHPDLIQTVFLDLGLAAVEGNHRHAAALVRRLPEFGWPYTLAHTDATALGLLRGDPVFEEVRELPDVRAVLDPIRARLANEREEVLRLGM